MYRTIAVLAQMGRRSDDHLGWAYGSSWVTEALMIVTMVAVVGGIVGAIVCASRSTIPSAIHARPHHLAAARLLLDERYACGDIDTEEYRVGRSALTQT